MFSFENDFAWPRRHTQGICSGFGQRHMALGQSFSRHLNSISMPNCGCSYFPLGRDYLSLILKKCTRGHFRSHNSHFLQIHGTAMGTKMASSYTNLFLARFEASPSETSHMVALHRWHLHDMNALIRGSWRFHYFRRWQPPHHKVHLQSLVHIHSLLGCWRHYHQRQNHDHWPLPKPDWQASIPVTLFIPPYSDTPNELFLSV